MEPPESLELKFTGETFFVKKQKTFHNCLALKRDGNTLTLYGQADNNALCLRILRKWLKKYAKFIFFPLLTEKAKNYGIAFSRFSAGIQKTAWGTCNSKGAIKLNAALLFLEPPLAEYVMVHELCHRLEMNHSERFWNEVRKRMPDFETRREELKKVQLPAWLYEK